MNESAPNTEHLRRQRRRVILLVSSACLLILLAIGGWFATRKPAGQGWNVVLVTFDTTRADRIGYHGYERGRTPTLDALAREGVAYLRCYTPAPVTLPAHCSLMTGLTPLRHGVHDNGPDRLTEEVETLAEILARQGYATAAFVGAFVLDKQFGLAQGFQHYDDDLSGGKQADQFCYAERNARLVTDAALNWLSQQSKRPTFVWIHYFDPHSPYEAPGFDPTFTNLTAYDAEVSFADSQLKRVVDFFGSEKSRQTLFVVAADHGEGLGDHGEPTHGMFVYNSTLHVPLVVRFPDQKWKAEQIDVPVSLVDVLPSILQWLGLPSLADVDGQPLPLPADESHRSDSNERGIYFENYFVSNNYGWSPLRGAVWGNMKFIDAPRPELYNLSDDPRETSSHHDADELNDFRLRFKALTEVLQARGCFSAQTATLTSSEFGTLESLGYAGSRAGAASSTDEMINRADPKDMVNVLAKIQEATNWMDAKQHREAVDLLIPIVASDDPGNPRAVRMLAALIVDAPSERLRVIRCLQQMRRLGRNEMDVDSLVVLGAGLLTEQQYEEAIEPLQEVTRLAPDYAEAHRYLGDCYSHLQRMREAAEHYRRAIDLAAHLNPPPIWLDQAKRQLSAASRDAAAADRTEENPQLPIR